MSSLRSASSIASVCGSSSLRNRGFIGKLACTPSTSAISIAVLHSLVAEGWLPAPYGCLHTQSVSHFDCFCVPRRLVAGTWNEVRGAVRFLYFRQLEDHSHHAGVDNSVVISVAHDRVGGAGPALSVESGMSQVRAGITPLSVATHVMPALT